MLALAALPTLLMAVPAAPAAQATLAVVDLSTTPLDEDLIAALRETDEAAKRELLPARRTRAVVDDAASLGIRCRARVDNETCLEKLRHLLRVDEVLVVALDDGTVALALVDEAGVVGTAELAWPADDVGAAARLAWHDLMRPPPPPPPVKRVIIDPPLPPPAPPPPTPPPQAAPATTEGALPASAVVGVIGLGTAAVCGVGAVLVNAELERQQGEANAGRGPGLGAGFVALEQALAGLTIAAAVGGVAGAIGGALWLMEPASTPAPALSE